MPLILPSVYNGPIVYYALLAKAGQEIIVERYDHYNKQTYRNRCRLTGPNQVIDLTIPVVNDHGNKTLMKDVRIDYSTRWRQVHWRTIRSSYASSPFFEFTSDAFQPYYETLRFDFLFDLNQSLLETTLGILQLPVSISASDVFTDADENDPREYIHPKRPFTSDHFIYHPVPYDQVFGERHGFIKNLSILDLIFNAGPDALTILNSTLMPKKNPDR